MRCIGSLSWELWISVQPVSVHSPLADLITEFSVHSALINIMAGHCFGCCRGRRRHFGWMFVRSNKEWSTKAEAGHGCVSGRYKLHHDRINQRAKDRLGRRDWAEAGWGMAMHTNMSFRFVFPFKAKPMMITLHCNFIHHTLLRARTHSNISRLFDVADARQAMKIIWSLPRNEI